MRAHKSEAETRQRAARVLAGQHVLPYPARSASTQVDYLSPVTGRVLPPQALHAAGEQTLTPPLHSLPGPLETKMNQMDLDDNDSSL